MDNGHSQDKYRKGAHGLFKELRRAHVVCFVVFATQALAYQLASRDAARDLLCRHLVIHEADEQTRTYTCASVRLSTLITMYLLFAAVHHAVVVFMQFDKYASLVRRATNFFRWSEYLFSSSIMIAILAILVGIDDLLIILLLASCQATCILFGAIWEVAPYSALPHVAAWLPFCVEWGIILHQHWLNMDVGASYLRILIPLQLLTFVAFGAVQALEFMKVGPFKSYTNVEVTFLTLSILAKTILASTVFLGQNYA